MDLAMQNEVTFFMPPPIIIRQAMHLSGMILFLVACAIPVAIGIVYYAVTKGDFFF